MEIRQMAGWCLMLLGVAKVFQAIHLHTMWGHKAGTLSIAIISLLFTAGAALLWLRKAPLRSQT